MNRREMLGTMIGSSTLLSESQSQDKQYLVIFFHFTHIDGKEHFFQFNMNDISGCYFDPDGILKFSFGSPYGRRFNINLTNGKLVSSPFSISNKRVFSQEQVHALLLAQLLPSDPFYFELLNDTFMVVAKNLKEKLVRNTLVIQENHV